ncbi:MAG: ectonucleotide pyrophosphatase/phosphodiesterase [Gemmatimonadaceae bacterium]
MLRKLCCRSALAGALLVAFACSPAPRTTSGSTRVVARPYVVMVSFDAFRHDYVDRYKPAAFLDVASRGVQAAAMIPSFPSKTFPNHFTLVTGLYPGHHGIVGNAFFDPARREWYRIGTPAVRDSSWYSGEPIWVTAERRGVKAGVFFWPGSEAAIEGVRPSYMIPYDAKTPNTERVAGAVAWMRKPPSERPHLVLLYFSDVDDTTHRYGPDAPQTATAVSVVNRALRQLLDSIRALPYGDSANVVLVSDHGMAQISLQRTIPVGDILARAGVDTTRMEASDNGPTMSLWFGTDSARMRRARAVLDTVGHVRTYLRSEIPERWHLRDNPRAGDVLLVADERYVLLRRGTDTAKVTSRGSHGWDPRITEMQGIFVAAGPNVQPLGRISAFENVNVYPFLAALLRLDRPPVVDGNARVLESILR